MSNIYQIDDYNVKSDLFLPEDDKPSTQVQMENHDWQSKHNPSHFVGNYQYDYNWIDELAGAVDVLTKAMILPAALVDKLSSVSEVLTEIYNEACLWKAE